MTEPFTESAGIPTNAATPFTAFSSVVLSVPGRQTKLRVKVSAPAMGDELPTMLLSHGHGPSNFTPSLHGYGPVADYWVAHGFVVVQPTHLDSMMLGLREIDHYDAPLYARSRAKNMTFILDNLDQIEQAVPGLDGRLDPSRIAAVGHSMGGHTVGLLCGQQIIRPAEKNMADVRVKVGVLMAPPGNGEDLNGTFASENYPIISRTNFASMTKPALVVVGEKDWNRAFSDRNDWRADAYYTSPGPKALLTLFGAEHGLGGVSMYDAAETTDENPNPQACRYPAGTCLRLPPQRTLSWRPRLDRSYLRFKPHARPLGKLESK